jgi:hypothetical protein
MNDMVSMRKMKSRPWGWGREILPAGEGCAGAAHLDGAGQSYWIPVARMGWFLPGFDEDQQHSDDNERSHRPLLYHGTGYRRTRRIMSYKSDRRTLEWEFVS